jgi:hypothetical protein
LSLQLGDGGEDRRMRAMQHGRRGLKAAGSHHGVETLQVVQGEFGHVNFYDRDYPIFVISSKRHRGYICFIH